jgi:hypothetical protein
VKRVWQLVAAVIIITYVLPLVLGLAMVCRPEITMAVFDMLEGWQR